MTEFRNIRFFDGQKEVTPEIASKDLYFIKAYKAAKKIYYFVIDDINNHNGVLVLNNSEKYKMIGLNNISPELKRILVSNGILK